MLSRRRRVFLTVVVAVAGVLRFAQWGAPLTPDEGYMVSERVRYNTHPLLALVLRSINAVSPTDLLDTLADIRALQLPSLAASIASLGLLYAVAAELTTPAVAVLAVAALGVSFWSLVYGHMLRGYSLSAFLNLLNLWIVIQVLLRRRARLLWFLPFTLAAAHYAILLNLFHTLALAAWAAVVLWLRRGLPAAAWNAGWPLFLAMAAGLALTYAAYLPHQGSIGQTAAVFTAANSWSFQSAAAVATNYLRVLGSPGAFAGGYLLAASLGILFCLRRRGVGRLAGLLMACYLVLPPLALFLARLDPWTRYLTGTLPFWALAFAKGLQAAAFEAAARMHFMRGAYERAALLMARAQALEPSLERAMGLGIFLHLMYRYADDIRLLRGLVQGDGAVNARIALASELMITYEIDEARAVLKGVLRSDPGNTAAKKMLDEMRRVPSIP
ncbi:MAG: hypothetical protein HY748_09770 [Elusimicrobia bacterium]|nr:hypothetical protein [Elusimicrobiota bacterium]